MSKITTHVLDVTQGCPARGVPVFLEFETSVFAWKMIGKGVTDEDGRLRNLLSSDYPLQPGNYRIRFNTGAYFSNQNIQGFYPEVSVSFTIRDASQHYHVPLLLSPFGYSTYRGS
ncbi:hydroxyisourate hydrolase [Candidatus Acetothermia bacterium]|nr:hydroxyisourate hydrolase [Candidatus Acetothermia bacterium]